MDTKVVFVLVLGVALIAVTVWWFYPTVPAPVQLPAGAIPRFMHCPKCGYEAKYKPQQVEQGCSKCGYDESLVLTEKSIAETGGRPNPYVRMIAPLLIEVNLLLGAVWFLTRFKTLGQRKRDDVDYHHTKCPKCKRRLRFTADKIGHHGLCPGCKEELVFSAAEAS